MAMTEPLTEQEQQALDQMRRAQEQGSTLKQLAPAMGLKVHQLYQLRRSLVRKGAFGPLPGRKARKSNKVSAFVPVRVVPTTSTQKSAEVSCRLVHPSGWVLECNGLPPATWISAVLAGDAHVAS
jgi:transposase-like protein